MSGSSPRRVGFSYRGSTLILTLFLVTIFFVLGIGLLGRRAPQYESAVHSVLETRARAVSEAGLEDARIKLQHDQHFPPLGDEAESRFSYREALQTVDGSVIGYFEVVIDRGQAAAPESLLWVTSSGVLTNPSTGEETFRKVLRAEYDVAYYDRTAPPANLLENSRYLELLRIEEVGAP